MTAAVAGGGQAGLAVVLPDPGRYRQRDRRRRTDGRRQLRNRWDTLRLFTPAKYDGLPERPNPNLAVLVQH